MTFNDLRVHTSFYQKNCLYIVSIHRTCYQNQFKNEFVRKKKTIISEFYSPGVFSEI